MSRLLALLLLVSALSFEQAFTGSISGLVTDPTGAVVADAVITVTDVSKNTNYRATSNATGFYVVSQLPPSTYRVTAEQTGFRRFVLEALPLATQQSATVNLTMALGAVTEQVSVTAEAQLIESASSTLSAVVENKKILDLPLNGRNIFQLAALVPGVFFVRQTSGVADTFTANRFIVNGGQESTSDIVLDGVTATVSHNIVNIPAVSAIPSVEGIQEFRIQTNAFAAEYGRSGGGLVTLVTKSGTNDIHGSLYEFFRNSKLDANGFFTNRAGVPLASFKQNQFGGSIGGPVYLPKLYNGKNKMFFFADYEGQRKLQGSTASHTVPTDLERQGNFTQTFTAAGVMRPIYDPFSTRPDPARPGQFLRDPFAGNIIPRAMFNNVAVKSMEYYPVPNGPGLPFTRQNNLVLQDAYPQPQDRIEYKIDYNFNDRRRMFGRYTYMDSVYSKPNFWKNLADPGCCDPMNQRLQNIALDYTENIGSTMVLVVRYGLGRVSGNRVPWSSTFDPQNGFKVTSLGLPASIDQVSDHQVFPTITTQDMTQLGPNSGDIYFMGDTTHTAIATLSRVSGRHSVKYGFDFRKNFVNYGQLGTPSGNFSFNRNMTQGPDPRVAGNSGIGFASFLLGTGSSSVSHQIRPANANSYKAFYVQDDFKVNSKLTVNVGFRWDFEGGNTERYNRMTAVDPFAKNPIADRMKMDLKGIALFAGDTLGRRSIRNTYYKQWNPRFGFAYQLNDKTVIRSGYGIFFGLPSYAANSGYTGGAFSGSTSSLSTEPDGVTPKDTWSNPFPNGWTFPLGAKVGPNALLGRSLGGAWPEVLLPMYNQQWNFTIQRSLGKDKVFEIAYAGNKGTHLSAGYQFNQMLPELLSLGNALNATVPNPFFGVIDPGVALGQPTVQYGNLLRPYPHYSGVSASNAAYANSNYHALQTRFEKRFSQGLSVLAAYTWSKTITDGADGLWNSADGGRNNYCRSCERAVSSYDQPHRFVLNSTYELPFGPSHALGRSWDRVTNAALGGWQVNAILTLSQGPPMYNWGVATSTCFCFGGTQRLDTTGVNAALEHPSIDRWFDTSQFTAPAPFTFGNLGRTVATIRADAARALDLSVFKSFRPIERTTVEFRAEAFNLTNTPLFNAPGLSFGSSTFGVVTSQQNAPRQIQLVLKIRF